MPAKPVNEDQQLDHGAQSVLQSTVFSEPWWKGVGTNPLGEAASNSSSMEQLHGSMANGAVQSQAHGGLGNGGNSSKENLITVNHHLGFLILVRDGMLLFHAKRPQDLSFGQVTTVIW